MELPEKMSPLAADLARVLIQFEKTGPPMRRNNVMRRSEIMFLYALVQNLKPSAPGIKASDLSSVLEITPGAVTHVVNELEKDGYVSRVSDPSDRRIVLIQPTEKGLEALSDTREEMLNELNRLVDYLGETDSRECIRLFSRVLNYYKQKSGI
jgi:DNA-binding MarR family transcriptional regulator